MTRLKERLKSQIAAAGPMGVAEFMTACLLDPTDGYYTTRMPFGRDGDFITAPEISQMFGEFVAVWLYAVWEALGRPESMGLAELGPGRGTMMRDMLRTLSKLDRSWTARLEVTMVEASPRLAAVQKETLGPFVGQARWLATVEQLPDRPLLVVGNEIFDALPIRQYQRASVRWHERVVGLGEQGEFALMLGPGAPDPSTLPPGTDPAADGSIWEAAPARTALMDSIAARIAAHGGAGLFFDYGHLRPGFGDTLQAVRKHEFEPILASPGEADLTAHVDFAALVGAVGKQGLAAWTATQGDFLLAMGLLERAGRLGAAVDKATQEKIRGEAERLAGPEGMGTLFKVLGVARPGVTLPALSLAEPG